MKWLVFFICLGIAGPVLAQEQKPPVQKQAAAKKGKKAAVAKKNRRQEDARHCLAQPTNTDIIRCAEAYL
jgi:hypothetical protein